MVIIAFFVLVSALSIQTKQDATSIINNADILLDTLV